MINLSAKRNKIILVGILIIGILILFVPREPQMDIYACKDWADQSGCNTYYCIDLLAPITESECEFLLQEKLTETGLDFVCKNKDILSGKEVYADWTGECKKPY